MALPPTGRIIVRLIDEQGKPVLEKALIGLKIGLSNRPPLSKGVKAPRSKASIPARSLHIIDHLFPRRMQVVGGEFIFPYVDLGQVYTVAGHREKEKIPLVLTKPGPTKLDETVVYTLVLPPKERIYRLTASLVDEKGRSLPDLNVEAFLLSGQKDKPLRAGPRTMLRSDGAGTIQLQFFPQNNDTGGLSGLLVRTTPGAFRPSLGGRVVRPMGGALEELDLGEIRLNPLPVFLGGTVRDEQGKPLAKTTVSITAWKRKPLWREVLGGVTMASTLSDKAGKFAFYGQPISKRYQLYFKKSGYAPLKDDGSQFQGNSGDIRVASGETAINLRLRAAGSVQGFFDHPPMVRANTRFSMQIRVKPDHGGPEEVFSFPTMKEGDRFHFAGLTPGEGRFILRLQNDKEPLLVIPHLSLLAGVTNRDPRLQGVDISHQVKLVQVRVVDVADKPIRFASVRVGPEFTRLIQLYQGGTACITLRNDLNVLKVNASGYREVKVQVTSQIQRVVLERLSR